MKLINIDVSNNESSKSDEKLEIKETNNEILSHRKSITNIESLAFDPRRLSLSTKLTKSLSQQQSDKQRVDEQQSV